jgi:DMSO reductase anchor subunit
MHPALSVLFFTTLSGAGYGLWFLLGLSLLCRWSQCAPGQVIDWQTAQAQLMLCQPAALPTHLLTGFVLVTLGLLASLGHLGQPQRAWRAFSQWRSSWLSREGVASLFTYVPCLLLLALYCNVTLRTGESALAAARLAHAAQPYLGALLMLGCIVTVFCTARIYSSLKTIHAWHNRYVLPGYLLLSLYSGALWCWVLAALPGLGWADRHAHIALAATIMLLACACALLKYAYWHFIDTTSSAATPASATGLGGIGSVRSFERPHTEDNYLTREMGFVVARKHADKLRLVALLCAFVPPLPLLELSLVWPEANLWCALAALLSASIGIFVERWLFFAQARHTVMLYYGADRA